MERLHFMTLAVLGLSAIFMTGNMFPILVVQPLHSSPEDQSDDGDQQQDEPVEEPESEPEPEPLSEDLPSDEQEDSPVTQEPFDPQAEKEICVTNTNGQKFCYKELKPDEACLKPINAEDPPICPPPETEGIVNGTSGDPGNPFDVGMATTTDPTGDLVSEGIAINEKGKPADCLVKKIKC